MIPDPIIEKITLDDGREITIQTGQLAKQADGAVVVQMNNTMLLATVVAAKEAKEGVDFLPLTVDYREKFYSGGRIPGNFFRREARPSDNEILTMRLVDRVLRPLFPKDYHAEVQVMISLISYDGTVNPDSLAGLAASSAIAITDIPFNGPMSEVRVIRKNGEHIINPSYEDIEGAEIDIMVGATKASVVMIEGEMDEVSESEMMDAIDFGHSHIKKQIEAQERLAEKVGGTQPKREYSHEDENPELKDKIEKSCYDKVYDIAKHPSSKEERSEKFDEVFEEFMSQYSEEEREELEPLGKVYFGDVKKEAVRQLVLNEGIRLDGRSSTDIRPIWSMVDYLPMAHGSAVFTRGETQSLTAMTLGSSLDANRIDSVVTQHDEKFYLHYNFPPFSTGEARPIRGTSRREVGHGNLAQRALENILPDDNPYVIRIVSDILESNGSSSMATVCAGTLSLMDGGIQIKTPVSGIAMGLITDTDTGKYAVLSDILGDEDHLGDMDFKVTGSEKGITACQMDIKIQGLSREIMEKALEQAREGRLHILGEMLKTLPAPRPELKEHAPKLISMTIPKDYIGAVIGPGGKIIQEMQAETGTVITIEEVDDKGIIEISGVDPKGIQDAVTRIKEITFEPEVGEVYDAKVKSIKDFGAFVEIKRGVEGLVHISEISNERVNNVTDVLKEGQMVKVKYVGNDPKSGKMRLSMKAVNDSNEKQA